MTILAGAVLGVGAILLLIAIGMAVSAGRNWYVIEMQTDLFRQLCRYAYDSRWKESEIKDRVQWLANGALLVRQGDIKLNQPLPSERDIVLGVRADDFFRWKATQKDLTNFEKTQYLLPDGRKGGS